VDRRSFIGLLGAGIAGIALEQAIPLGRVWSFPKEIVVANPNLVMSAATLGFMASIRMPQRYRVIRKIGESLYGVEPDPFRVLPYKVVSFTCDPIPSTPSGS
jgi:hypothetical protein